MWRNQYINYQIASNVFSETKTFDVCRRRAFCLYLKVAESGPFMGLRYRLSVIAICHASQFPFERSPAQGQTCWRMETMHGSKTDDKFGDGKFKKAVD